MKDYSALFSGKTLEWYKIIHFTFHSKREQSVHVKRVIPDKHQILRDRDKRAGLAAWVWIDLPTKKTKMTKKCKPDYEPALHG